MNGSIETLKTPSGRVRGYKVRWREFGRQRTKTYPSGTHGRKQAETKLREVRQLTSSLSKQQKAPLSVGQMVDAMLRARADELSPAYLETSKAHANNLRKFALWDRPASSVEPHELAAVLRKLAADGRSQSSVRAHRALLSSAYTWATSEGYTHQNPVRQVRTPKGKKAAMESLLTVEGWEVLSPEQVETLIQKSPPWAGDFITVLAFTGLRQGEALGLQVKDWDPVRSVASVTKSRGRYGVGAPKNKTSYRTVPIPERVGAVLDRMAKGLKPDDFLIRGARGGPLDANTFRRVFAKTIREVPGASPDLRPHHLRHVALTSLLNSGVAVPVVASIAGHSSPRITQQVYAGFISQEWEMAAEALNRIAGAATPQDS